MAGGSLQSRTVRLFLAVALNGGLFVVLRRLVLWSGRPGKGC